MTHAEFVSVHAEILRQTKLLFAWCEDNVEEIKSACASGEISAVQDVAGVWQADPGSLIRWAVARGFEP